MGTAYRGHAPESIPLRTTRRAIGGGNDVLIPGQRATTISLIMAFDIDLSKDWCQRQHRRCQRTLHSRKAVDKASAESLAASKHAARVGKEAHYEMEELEPKPVGRKNARGNGHARKAKVQTEPDPEDHQPATKKARGGARAKIPVAAVLVSTEEPALEPVVAVVVAATQSAARGCGQLSNQGQINPFHRRIPPSPQHRRHAVAEYAASNNEAPKRDTHSRRK
ncbi:GL20150 [Drosophila persimilis]|uniref:GL20150 n=1 Tax=Drosophila persimilis TaxID=7234 RepID=B4GY43_DROPE|nr:GL20150 [Drosophila persimilis]